MKMALEKIENYAKIWRHAEAQARKDNNEVLFNGAFVRASIYEHAAEIIRAEMEIHGGDCGDKETSNKENNG